MFLRNFQQDTPPALNCHTPDLTITQELEDAAQNIIEANQSIISAFSDEAHERRYWKINEFSQVPCGGTHIKTTGEIGTIRLKRVNPGKGKERIEIYVS